MGQAAASKDPRWLNEAEPTVQAIRHGNVDAFVVEEPEGHRVYALESADLPYTTLVERMQQAAAILNVQGEVIYCNLSLAQMLGVARETVIGLPLKNFVDVRDQASYQKLLNQSLSSSPQGELHLRPLDEKPIPALFSLTLLSRDRLEIGVLITDVTLQHQQRELASRLQGIQDEERRRIAHELHDSVGQLLVAISMNIEKVSAETSHLSLGAAQAVRESLAMVEEVLTQIRTISHLLHPPLLDDVGLPSALRCFIEGFSKRADIETSLEVPTSFPRLPPPVEIAIFRVVQECLNNIHRHSSSASCSVELLRNCDHVQIAIKDTGRGMDEAKISGLPLSGGVGLRGIQERIQKLGGKVEIKSSKNGTNVTVTLPVPE